LYCPSVVWWAGVVNQQRNTGPGNIRLCTVRQAHSPPPPERQWGEEGGGVGELPQAVLSYNLHTAKTIPLRYLVVIAESNDVGLCLSPNVVAVNFLRLFKRWIAWFL